MIKEVSPHDRKFTPSFCNARLLPLQLLYCPPLRVRFALFSQGHVVAVHKVLNGAARVAAFEEESGAVARARWQGANVQQCWHGTSPQALLSILKTGFTASRTVNGKAYGNGLYMAPGQYAVTSR